MNKTRIQGTGQTERKILVSTASVWDCAKDLDSAITLILESGADGVEIVAGMEFCNFPPSLFLEYEFLASHAVTLHAELHPKQGLTLRAWELTARRFPFKISNTVFHPDELEPRDFENLSRLPFPVSIENMDSSRKNWRTADEVRTVLRPGVGFTLDTAHAEANGLSLESFECLGTPSEIHLSKAVPGGGHSLTMYFPSDFPSLPSGCRLIVLEGQVTDGPAQLRDEIEFVRSALGINN